MPLAYLYGETSALKPMISGYLGCSVSYNDTSYIDCSSHCDSTSTGMRTCECDLWECEPHAGNSPPHLTCIVGMQDIHLWNIFHKYIVTRWLRNPLPTLADWLCFPPLIFSKEVRKNWFSSHPGFINTVSLLLWFCFCQNLHYVISLSAVAKTYAINYLISFNEFCWGGDVRSPT